MTAANRPHPALVPVLWAAVIAQFGLLIGGAVLDAVIAPRVGPLDAAFGAVSTLTFPAVGAVLLARRPDHPISWLFAGANAGWAINNFSGSYVHAALGGHLLPAVDLFVWLSTWPSYLSMAMYVLLLLLFPTGRLPSPAWRPLGVFTVAWAGVGGVAAAFAGMVDASVGPPLANPLAAPEPFGALFGAGVMSTRFGALVLLALAAAALAVRLHRASGIERQQLKWFMSTALLVALTTLLFGAAIAAFGFANLPGWGRLLQEISVATPGLLPVAAGIAILRYRLYDIDLVIRRTLVYGAVVAVLGAVYVVLVLVLQTALTGVTGGQTIPVAASTLVIAALFGPVRARVREVVDRRFYRSRYDAQRTLEAFAGRLRDEVELEAVAGALVAVVTQTVRPASVGTWIRRRPS